LWPHWRGEAEQHGWYRHVGTLRARRSE
jgi:hypothetical protein